MWKSLPDNQKQIWKDAATSTKDVPAVAQTSSSRLNCSSFFHKIVACWSNPSSDKGKTFSMEKRSKMWKAKIEGYEAKTYWKEALKVWQDEKETEAPAFLKKHPEYAAKIKELAEAAEAAEEMDVVEEEENKDE